jgi:DNA-binding NarL/FixJ family response regulator
VVAEQRGRHFDPDLLDAFVAARHELAAIRTAFPDVDEQERIRILVVDDHDVFVQSLVRLLGSYSDLRIVGVAATVAAATEVAAGYKPDVVLMDFELPDGDGPAATRAVKALLPGVQVVMLTGRTDRHSFIRAISAGCAGFVAKTEGVERLVAAVRSAYAGEDLAPLAELSELLASLPATSRGMGRDLSARELEVLSLMAAGLPNRRVAERLHVSLNTVRNHVQSILYKLDAHSRLEAVAVGVREGLIARPTSDIDR